MPGRTVQNVLGNRLTVHLATQRLRQMEKASRCQLANSKSGHCQGLSVSQALGSDRDREELFMDHIKERDRKERETRKVEQKKRMAAFRVLLENSSFIKVGLQLSSAWCDLLLDQAMVEGCMNRIVSARDLERV